MQQPKILSLASKRSDKKRLTRKAYLDTDTRFRELEEDMLRVIDLCLDLDATVSYQAKAIRLLIKAIKELQASSASPQEPEVQPGSHLLK